MDTFSKSFLFAFIVSAISLTIPRATSPSASSIATYTPEAKVTALHDEAEYEYLPDVTVTIPHEEIEILTAESFAQ